MIRGKRSQASGPERERLHAELAQLILDLRAMKDGWEKARPAEQANPSPHRGEGRMHHAAMATGAALSSTGRRA